MTQPIDPRTLQALIFRLEDRITDLKNVIAGMQAVPPKQPSVAWLNTIAGSLRDIAVGLRAILYPPTTAPPTTAPPTTIPPTTAPPTTAPPTTAPPTTILTVTTLLDRGAGSLREQIAAALPGARIVFQPGMSGTILLSLGELTISKDLTITGPANRAAISIDGFTNGRIFDVTAGTVAIANLTITNGIVTPYSKNGAAGGGVFSAGKLTLTNCALVNNTAYTNFNGASGGGVSAMGYAASLTLIDCLVSNNKVVATDPTYGVDARGGGVEFGSITGDLVMRGCTVTRNKVNAEANGVGRLSNAGAAHGGGVMVHEAVRATLTGCTVGDNTITATAGPGNTKPVQAHGGGISYEPDPAGVTSLGLSLIGCTVTGNKNVVTAGGLSQGGGYYTNGAKPTTSASTTITGNSALIDPDVSGMGPSTTPLPTTIPPTTVPPTTPLPTTPLPTTPPPGTTLPPTTTPVPGTTVPPTTPPPGTTPLILLTPARLATLRSLAAANDPLWVSYKGALDGNLLTPYGYGSYQGSSLPGIADFGLGYLILQQLDPVTAARYADKAIAILKSDLRDYQKGSNVVGQFYGRGDGAQTVYQVPADIVPSTLIAIVTDVSVVPVVRALTGSVDTTFYYEKVIKISDTPDGTADYREGVDWRRNPAIGNNVIEWLAGGRAPAPGATYHLTATTFINGGTYLSAADRTLSGGTVVLRTALPATKALYLIYIYGTHAADYSTLAYQQSGSGDGGFDSIIIDTSYTSRYLGQYAALGLNWLSDYPGLTGSLRAETISLLKSWYNYVRDQGYFANSIQSNYGAGGYCSRVMTALALLSAGDASAPAMVQEVLNYRTTVLIPQMSSSPPTPSLLGGHWAEGWNYGPLSVVGLVKAAVALEVAGLLTASTERAWATQAIMALLTEQPANGQMYNGGDWYANPAPFPDKSLFRALAVLADSPAARSYVSRLLATYPGTEAREHPILLFPAPTDAPTDWSAALPPSLYAPGTGLAIMRADWSMTSDWSAFSAGNLLACDHQMNSPGHLQIQRGPDDLLINPNAVSGNQNTGYQGHSNVVIIDAGGDIINGQPVQIYRFCPGFWYGTPGVVMLANSRSPAFDYYFANYRAAYSSPSNPGGGGAVAELKRQVVYLRPDIHVVYDRATTLKPEYSKQLRWYFMPAPTWSQQGPGGVVFSGIVGGSAYRGQTVSRVPLAAALNMVPLGDANLPVPQLVITPAAPISGVRYLTVFQSVAISAHLFAPGDVTPLFLSDLRMEGAQVNGPQPVGSYLILFGSTDVVDLTTPFVYSTAASPVPVTHRVFNLSPGQSYRITAGGSPLTQLVAGQDGSISFPTPGGVAVQIGLVA